MLFSFHSFRAATTVLALAALAACSSKKDDAAPAPTTPAGLSWTVDGAAVSTTTVQSQKTSSTISMAGTVIGTTSSYLALQLPNAVGTFAFSASPLASGSYSSTSGSTTAVYYAGTLPAASGMSTVGAGTIVVTALTATNVTGTFTFTGIGPAGAAKAITSGTFNVGL